MSDRRSVTEILASIRANHVGSPVLPSMPSFEHLSDQSLLRLYEDIRHQVNADKALGNRYRLIGQAAKARAERLREEMVSRELKFSPIVWE